VEKDGLRRPAVQSELAFELGQHGAGLLARVAGLDADAVGAAAWSSSQMTRPLGSRLSLILAIGPSHLQCLLPDSHHEIAVRDEQQVEPPVNSR